jgi:ADP-ribose pyrophosphatase YjhB (NUDIX family)
MASPLDHEVQRRIILKLIHNPKMGFNELWAKEGESNAFAYHLNKLEELGMVGKTETTYHLTEEGRKLSAFIEGDTGGKAEMPTPTVIILVRQGNKILCQQRLKEPFYGYWGLPSGKINFGWNPQECAIRDLKEEAGLDAEDITLREIECTKTYDDGKLLHHHLMWTFEVTKFSGELKERTHKAVNKFLTQEEIEQQKRFPGDWSLRYFTRQGVLTVAEKERHMHKGEGGEIKIINKDEYKHL